VGTCIIYKKAGLLPFIIVELNSHPKLIREHQLINKETAAGFSKNNVKYRKIRSYARSHSQRGLRRTVEFVELFQFV